MGFRTICDFRHPLGGLGLCPLLSPRSPNTPPREDYRVLKVKSDNECKGLNEEGLDT